MKGMLEYGFLRAKYVTEIYRDSKWKQFLNLKQRSLSVAEYEKEFSHLSKYAPESVLTEAFRCRQFEDRLDDSIKRYLAPMTSLKTVDFYQLVQAAMKVEKLETSSKENLKRRSYLEELRPPREKELENLQLNPNIVPLREVEGKGPM